MNKSDNKNSISIKLLIMVPVIILGVVSILSNLLSVYNLRNVNNSAKTIADTYMRETQDLASIQEATQDIHSYALSHIIATDFNTMVTLVNNIDTREADLDAALNDYQKYETSDDNDYKEMLENYDGLKQSIKSLLAFSANQDTVSAYATANGDLTTYAAAMTDNITTLTERVNSSTKDARSSLSSVYKFASLSGIIFIIVSIASVVIAIFVVLKMVIKPILLAERQINEIITDIDNGQGDLTKRITISNDDEIGSLGNGINTFMEKLQQIFLLITENSDKMENVVSEVLGSVRTSNDSASDLSAVTEELAATMQEVANNANAINTNAEEVNLEVLDIAEKSIEINEYSKQMKQHADSMEQAAKSNMEETSTKVNEILEILSKAIEDSKSVDQVNSLTDDILNISSQTNLLALNASIEAARAGEAGKGFSVVAGEISALADSSRVAANNIQEINLKVTEAVHNLADNANNLVSYMQDSILPEFKNFVESGGQYRENATYIENTMTEFSAKTDSLKVVVSEIADSLNSITSAIDEGVKGVSGAADSTQTLVYDMDNITSRMDENQRIAGELQQETSIFKKL